MNLHDVTAVYETTKCNTAQDYISLGWKLERTYTTCYSEIGQGSYHQTIHYVLIWFGENPKYPEK